MDRHDIYTADECFLTGTAAEVIPVVECDGRAIGTGQARPDHAGPPRAVPRAGPRTRLSRREGPRVLAIRRILAPTDFSHTPRPPCATPAGWPSGSAPSCTCCTCCPRSSPSVPTRCSHPHAPRVLPGERGTIAQDPGTFARPLVGGAADRPDGRRLVGSVEGIVDYARDHEVDLVGSSTHNRQQLRPSAKASEKRQSTADRSVRRRLADGGADVAGAAQETRGALTSLMVRLILEHAAGKRRGLAPRCLPARPSSRCSPTTR